LKLVQRQKIGDARGFLSRIFCAEELAVAGWIKPVFQVNHTLTKKSGTVRGLHYQRPPHTEMKLVSCIRGEVWDVAVDIRRGSKTFLRWHAERLSADNGRAVLIPEGCAHGFQALTDNVELLYLHSHPYSSTAESGLNAADKTLAIAWPLAISERSLRDSQHEPITDQFAGIVL
jgi:dTDP-4-dehydrorhamnose 3,5-epimerase